MYLQQAADGAKLAVTPDLSTRSMEVEVALVNRYLGIQLSASSIADLVSRMALDASPSPCGSHVTVHIPPTRSDVLHPCDVIEVRCRCAVACMWDQRLPLGLLVGLGCM